MTTRRGVRQVGAKVLLVLGGVALVVASTGWWLERSFLNSGHFTRTANELLDDDAVQTELTAVLVEQISERAGTNLQLAQPFLASIVSNVVESDPFRAVFDAALSNAHRVFVDRGTERIILNLTSAYDQIKAPLEQVAPNLAAELPSRSQLNVVLLHRSELTTVWDTIDTVKRIVLLITIAAVVLLAAGIALAEERWRALAFGAWVVVGGAAVLAVVLVVARPVIQSRISDGVLADAIVASFRVITTPLVVQTIVVLVVAATVALLAGFTARAGLPAWRPTVRRGLDSLSGAVRDSEVPVAGLGRLRLPPPGTESIAVRVWRAIALLALGLFALFDPASVATVIVVIAGVALLALALFEAIAAWRLRPRHAPGSEAPPA